MDETSVMVRFSIYGEDILIPEITQKLDLIPTETHSKGDLKKNGKEKWEDTSWSINTGYEPSYDINIQVEKILSLLEGKTESLAELKRNYVVNMIFMIVVKIENKETPAMYFNKPFIQFLSKIDAEVGFDLYVYS